MLKIFLRIVFIRKINQNINLYFRKVKRISINNLIGAGESKNLMIDCEHIVGTFFVVALLYINMNMIVGNLRGT